MGRFPCAVGPAGGAKRCTPPLYPSTARVAHIFETIVVLIVVMIGKVRAKDHKVRAVQRRHGSEAQPPQSRHLETSVLPNHDSKTKTTRVVLITGFHEHVGKVWGHLVGSCTRKVTTTDCCLLTGSTHTMGACHLLFHPHKWCGTTQLLPAIQAWNKLIILNLFLRPSAYFNGTATFPVGILRCLLDRWAILPRPDDNSGKVAEWLRR